MEATDITVDKPDPRVYPVTSPEARLDRSPLTANVLHVDEAAGPISHAVMHCHDARDLLKLTHQIECLR